MHRKHVPVSIPGKYVPGEHGTQNELELAPALVENFPGGHRAQSLIETAPEMVEYFPAGHWGQDVTSP